MPTYRARSANPCFLGHWDDFEIVIAVREGALTEIVGTPTDIVVWAEKVIEIAKAHITAEVTE